MGANHSILASISPIVVPSPNVSGSGDWKKSVKKARQFTSRLTLSELVNITTGAGIVGRCVGNTGSVPRLGFKVSGILTSQRLLFGGAEVSSVVVQD